MANALLDAALAYAKRGWPIFPCDSAKRPRTHNGFHDATTDAAQIEAWWQQWPRAGIGFEPGSVAMMALDFDCYKGGFDWAAAKTAIGGLPETGLVQLSPRGGEHHLFKLDKGEFAASTASKIAGAVDVRGMGGYILLAPSRTADGEYSWKSYKEAARRSDEMLRLANTARAKSGDRDNWIIDPDLPENIDAAIDWLKHKAKAAVEGQGGDHTAYATAAMMKSYGISDAMALDLMWDYWNPRCTPPWSADELEHFEQKVRNGYSYNTSPPGNVTEAYRVASASRLFQPVRHETAGGGVETQRGRFRFVDRLGMEAIKPPRWLVDDLLPLGAYCLLFGAPGTFKTFVALDIALNIACPAELGVGLWAIPDGMDGNVLFVAGEGRAELTKRVAAWEKLHNAGERVERFLLADPVPHVDEQWQPFVEEAKARSPQGYRLIVLDTVGRSMQGLNENAQEHASKLTRQVEILQREFGATVLALHHTGHDKGNAGRARGSSVFGADADTLVRLDREDKATIISLTMTKQKDAPEWAAPKHVKLQEVKLARDIASLACCAPNEKAPEPRKPEAAMRDRTQEKAETAANTAELATLQALGETVAMILKQRGGSFAPSSSVLAQLLVQSGRFEWGDDYIRKHKLKLLYNVAELRERYGRLYDPVLKRWKWSE